MKPNSRINHLFLDDISSFIGVDQANIRRNEDILFPDGLSRNINNWRYTDIYTLCDAYYVFWNKKPTWDYVASWLFEWGIVDPSDAQEVLLKLKAHDKLQ